MSKYPNKKTREIGSVGMTDYEKGYIDGQRVAKQNRQYLNLSFGQVKNQAVDAILQVFRDSLPEKKEYESSKKHLQGDIENAFITNHNTHPPDILSNLKEVK